MGKRKKVKTGESKIVKRDDYWKRWKETKIEEITQLVFPPENLPDGQRMEIMEKILENVNAVAGVVEALKEIKENYGKDGQIFGEKIVAHILKDLPTVKEAKERITAIKNEAVKNGLWLIYLLNKKTLKEIYTSIEIKEMFSNLDDVS